MRRRVAQLVTALALAAQVTWFAVAPAFADESHGYLKDVEIRWRSCSTCAWSPWEDPAYAQTYGQSSKQAQVWVEVVATANERFKIAVWSPYANAFLKSTVQTMTAGQTFTWESPAFTTPVVEEAMGVYLYKWNGSAYVQDDVAYGWTGVHSFLRQDGVTGDWGPNGVGRGAVTYSADGTYANYRQQLWWWDNSTYTQQTNGTARLNRLKAWANRGTSVRWTIEFRRLDRPIGAGLGTAQNQEGWDFKAYVCGTRSCVTRLNAWWTNLPGLRTSDIEESAYPFNGDEEAQFESGSDQVAKLAVVKKQKPAYTYTNQYYLDVQFTRRSANKGDTVYIATNMQLQRWTADDYFEFLGYRRAGI